MDNRLWVLSAVGVMVLAVPPIRGAAAQLQNGKSTVRVSNQLDPQETNAYKIWSSSPTKVTWYDAGENVLCEKSLPGRWAGWQVDRLSEDRSVVILIAPALEEEEQRYFEMPLHLPQAQAIAFYDAFHAAYLEIINSNCDVLYSSASIHGGWNMILLSPFGKWVSFEESESAIAVPGQGWKYFLKVVELATGQTFIIDWDRNIVPREISDEGTIKGRKYLGDSQTFFTYKDPDGEEHKQYRSRVQWYEWRPGMSNFQGIGNEIEE